MKTHQLSLIINDAIAALLQAREGEANRLLGQVFEEMLDMSASFSPETLAVLAQIMKIMHDAQYRRDHVYLVDILKYELPKHIALNIQ
jgi:hypothetical protein